MELTQLRYFQVAAEECNFTRASEKLSISQPALSQAISKLESEIGFPLFTRDRNRLTLSSFGYILLQSVNIAVLELDNGLRQARLSAGLDAGVVNIIMSEFVQISEVVEKFLLDFPDVFYHEKRVASDEIEDILLSGGADFAVSYEKPRDTKLACVPLYRDRLSVLLSSNNPLSQREVLSLQDLNDQRVLQGDGLGNIQFSRIFTGTALHPKRLFEGIDSFMVTKLVGMNRGISLCPFSVCEIIESVPRPGGPTQICHVPLEENFWRKDINLIYLKRHYFSESAEELMNRLQSFFATLPPAYKND